VSYVRTLKRAGCACAEPGSALVMAERAVLVAEPRAMRESTARAHRGAGSDPVVLGASDGSKCRPFLKVEKDPAKFAACNALAEEIGPLNTPKKAYRLIEEAIGDEQYEVFGLVTLDLHLRMKSVAETGRGEHAAVMAPMVPTLQAAIIDGAHSVIIFHCHPSGIEAEPSPADKETTKAFVKAFEILNVNFIDHVICAGDAKRRSYYSFAENNAL
jgi:DNA repair protein RadC